MAYAPTIQAETGFTQNTLRQFGAAGDERRSDALSHADVYAGLHAAIAALAALQQRRVSGRGQYVDVAMAAVLTSINERVHYDLSDEDLGAEVPILGATDCPFFTSADGVELFAPMSLVGSMSFRFYLHAMRRPDLADDPRFRTPELRARNLDALHGIVQSWIDAFDSMASLDAQFDEAKIATGRLRDAVEFNETDWATSWITTREVSDRSGGVITIPAPPWHFSDHDGTLVDQIPAHQGEHNEAILRELHRTDDDIAALRVAGALVGPSTGAGACRTAT